MLAVALIKVALLREWNALELYTQIQDDHDTTKDNDPNAPYNSKTGCYTQFQVQKRRFQELILGNITFLDRGGCFVKGLERGNNGGNTADHADRRRCRKEATLQYVKTLNVTEL